MDQKKLSRFAEIGLVALIYDVSGYQEERFKNPTALKDLITGLEKRDADDS